MKRTNSHVVPESGVLECSEAGTCEGRGCEGCAGTCEGRGCAGTCEGRGVMEYVSSTSV